MYISAFFLKNHSRSGYDRSLREDVKWRDFEKGDSGTGRREILAAVRVGWPDANWDAESPDTEQQVRESKLYLEGTASEANRGPQTECAVHPEVGSTRTTCMSLC